MKIKLLLTAILASSPMLCAAHTITTGEPVPNIEVDKHGEILLKDDKTHYQAWSTESMLGKVRVIQAIAGRSSAKEMNAELMAAITAKEFDAESYQTTTIINQDDAMWGTGSFVKSSAESSKQEFPWSSMVLDSDGVVAQQWQLAEESSAIIVQNKSGEVLFVKEGALSAEEIAQVLSLIEQNL
ncbi:YtfJ family protein [Vibrio mexicanus]|uniref:YtfJ family protein n=1 Tax=Vibrio mexicanus TaxID=1004326 RepID=UPI00063C4C1B|nr:YtfJ family protein [Vibrio mexicanus]